jgi:hypothetical protein
MRLDAFLRFSRPRVGDREKQVRRQAVNGL